MDRKVDKADMHPWKPASSTIDFFSFHYVIRLVFKRLGLKRCIEMNADFSIADLTEVSPSEVLFELAIPAGQRPQGVPRDQYPFTKLPATPVLKPAKKRRRKASKKV